MVFLFQTQLESLLAWEQPTHTLSFLFVYSFICLDPHLILVLPLVILLLFIMVPAFIARHPPPPSTSTSSITPYYSYDGPALAPARTIKPAPETSRDFLRNMRDLQNTMADFSDIHDLVIALVAPLTDFSDEQLSSTIFLVCTVATAVLFLSAHLVPLKWIMLAGGNAAILSNNPTIRHFFVNLIQEVNGEDLNLGIDDDEAPNSITGSISKNPAEAMSALGKLVDICVDTDPEEREVEIFEIQHRGSEISESGWENFLFSPQPYDPLSPSRIAGDRPRGCRFFDDVRPPTGWKWKSKKWQLDLDCREWVVERMITGVGFEIPGVTPDGRAIIDEIGGWVWDLPPESSQTREEGEEEEIPTMGYGDLDPESISPSNEKGTPTAKGGRGKSSRDWEVTAPASCGAGEWRRRRWVRVVQRMNLPPADSATVTYSTLGHN